jgi:MFS family permease
MPLYLGSYNLPAWLVGLLANERSFVGAIVQPIVGRISDRTHTRLGKRRPFFLVGIPLVCAGLLFLAFHPPFWLMLGVTAVLAFFLAVAWDPYMAMMADLFPERQRGRVGGLTGLGVGLGNILFIVLAMWLWGSNEFIVFLAVVVMLVVTWGYTFLTVKEPPSLDEPAIRAKKVGKPNPVAYVKNLMEYPEAAKYVLATTFFWLGTGGVIPFITPFGVRVLHATESQAFILPLGATVMNALLAIPMGILADRITKKKVMVGGMLIYGIIALVGSQAQNLWQGTIIMMMAGGANAAMVMINPMLTDLVPKKRMAEFVGLGSSVFSFAQPLGSFLAGIVVVLAGWMVGGEQAYRWAFIFAGVMLLTGAALLMRVHPERFVDHEDDIEPAPLPTMAY